jgi:hypothetical protein
MSTSDHGVSGESRASRTMVDRAARQELRIPLRFRLQGRQDWQLGETVNVSESGLLFSCDQLLDVDARVEITYQTTSGMPLLLERSLRRALVVRRILSNWPETRILFGARFFS